MRAPGRGPDPVPIVLCHGWPWTFWDYRRLIPLLTDPAAHGGDPADSFDVVVPSVPGFGFSTPVPRSGVTWVDAADALVAVMHRLGHRTFVAAGADWGTSIVSQLGHAHAESVLAIQVATGRPLDFWNVDQPWNLLGQVPVPDSEPGRSQVLAWQRKFAGHVSAHVLGSQTLANGMHDSPVALASWLLERRRAWSDCGGDVESVFSRDDLLVSFTLYWATDSFVSSARLYPDAASHPWRPCHDGVPPVAVPTAVTVFEHDVVAPPTREALSRLYDLRQLRVHPRGGHFAAFEQPMIVAADIRDAFRPLRE